MNFIDRIAEKIISSGSEPGDFTIVFPSRRAGLFLRKKLLEDNRVKKPFWAPEILTVGDFISGMSGKTLLDSTALTLMLYGTYRDIYGESAMAFDKFYPWARVIVSDFNDMDQNLADVDTLFRQLNEHLSADAEADVVTGFRSFAYKYGVLYREFKNRLEQDNAGYYGALVRQICSAMEEYIQVQHSLILAGFNALSRGETEIFKYLETQAGAEIIWDADRYFIDNTAHEAGVFFREYAEQNSSVMECCDDMLAKDEKNIRVMGVAGAAGQSKAASRYLEELVKQGEDPGAGDTAVVLCDEQMLFPVINSIPSDINDLNVTMGYPLLHTPVYTLTVSLIRLWQGIGESTVYVKDLEKVLDHPYVRGCYGVMDPEVREKTAEEPFIPVERLDFAPGTVREALGSVKTGIDFTRFILSFFKELGSAMEPEALGREFLKAFIDEGEVFLNALEKFGIEPDINSVKKLFREILAGKSVPFTGEPLKGLQVMGMLETRGLGFKNVILLGVNEKVFPKGKGENSIIPYELKKSSGMTTYEKKDAIFSYYYYRLLKYGKNILICYNTEKDAFGKGERSRFVEQTIRELAPANPKIELQMENCAFEAANRLFKVVEIPKEPHIIQKMESLKWSPTVLNSYLYCPVKFYFSKMLRLRRKEKLDEATDPGIFGTVVHESMEQLYRDYAGSIVTQKDVAKITGRVGREADASYMKNVSAVDYEKGRHLVNRRIIAKLLEEFLKIDMAHTPFRIVSLEKQYHIEFRTEDRTVTLYGFIDRVDEKEGVIRILDYKTGNISSLSLKNIEPGDFKAFEKKKEALQLLCYQVMSGEKNPQLGIISFRKLNEGIKYLYGDEQTYDLAEKTLKVLFNEIFDEKKPFMQTDDISKCGLCDFRDLCGR